jgi:hypothetical protein
MWIENRIQVPKERGYYKCLVQVDEFGTLVQIENELFAGKDWDLYESNCQFINYWWSDTREPLKELEDGLGNYF